MELLAACGWPGRRHGPPDLNQQSQDFMLKSTSAAIELKSSMVESSSVATNWASRDHR